MPAKRKRRTEESLTTALARLLEETVLPDLAEQAKTPDVAAALAEQHARERAQARTADSLAAWTQRWLTQIGAVWVLSCVFLRTLEDRGLVTARPASDDLLTALREVARLPAAEELLGPAENPAFRLPPSSAGARALLDFFREPDERGEGLRWRFGGSDTRFLGDLYQYLSADAREQYALIQTPVFVEELILDLTLQPAIAKFGLEETHLLDPACGSGHFLLGAFEQIFEHRKRTMPGRSAKDHALSALGQVHGVDLNPHAVAITKFRLTLAYLAMARIDRLADVPRKLPIEVVVADSLLDGATAVFGRKYQAVVANPPQSTCKDAALREAYRKKYVSAAGKYTLAAPFLERSFQLAEKGGFVGVFTANSFMKRVFGRRLVEQVLAHVDLTDVIDASGAYIPGYGIPMALLFARNRRPRKGPVTVTACRRGEPIMPLYPAEGRVWKAIVTHLREVGYTDDYISVFEVPRAALSQHPWSLGAGAEAEIMDALERGERQVLGQLWERATMAPRSGADDVFLQPAALSARLGFEEDVVRSVAHGDAIRDWGIEPDGAAVIPNLDGRGARSAFDPHARWAQFLWRYRAVLEQVPREDWYAWSRWRPDAQGSGAKIVLPLVATHNHFTLIHDEVVVTGGAAILQFAEAIGEDQRYSLLGFLNSSTACYWMKQVLFAKVPEDHGMASFGRHIEDDRYEFALGTLERLPVPRFVIAHGPVREQLADLAKRLTHAARELRERAPAYVLSRWDRASRESLLDALASAQQEQVNLLREMVRDQEDIDWLVYAAMGLGGARFQRSPEGSLPEERPFAWLSDEPPSSLDPGLADLWARRRRAAQADPSLSMSEQALYKRPFWHAAGHGVTDFKAAVVAAADEWLADRIEDLLRSSAAPRCVEPAEIVARLDRVDVRAVCSLGEVDLSERISELLRRGAVPSLAALRYTDSGLEKRAQWERTWALQRLEDAGEKLAAPIPVPPKYDAKDFRDPNYFRLRGKLDVPRERFILYLREGTSGHDLFGWAGWTHEERAAVLVARYEALKATRGDRGRALPLFSGMLELIPRLERVGEGLRGQAGPSPESLRLLVEKEAQDLGLSLGDIRSFRPGGGDSCPTGGRRGI